MNVCILNDNTPEFCPSLDSECQQQNWIAQATRQEIKKFKSWETDPVHVDIWGLPS